MRFISKILNPLAQKDGDFFIEIKRITGFKPKNTEIYKQAFIHRSLNKKDALGHPINYERLEFLGDSILSTVISNHLFKEAPFGDEGYLTKMRSKIVSRNHLNSLGKGLELLKQVRSKIPKHQFGENIHGNVFEALIGAIYLDLGYHKCERFIHDKVIQPHVDIEELEGKVISYKSLFIEWCQKHKIDFNYDVYEDNGNDALKHFGVRLSIHNKVIAKARATSKKKAEEKASQRAYYVLQNRM